MKGSEYIDRWNNVELIIRPDMQLPLIGNQDGGIKLYGESRIVRNRILKADCIDISITHADLITILAGYEYGSIELINGYVYRLKPMNVNLRRKFSTAAEFKSALKVWTKKKDKDILSEYKDFNKLSGMDLLSGKEKEEEVRQIVEDAYQNSKVLFNGIYGKACQSLIHNHKDIDEEGNITISEDEYKPRQGTCYTTGRYIATYTRLHLCMAYFISLRCIGRGDLILYAHTDSLKLFLYGDDHEEIVNRILNIYNKGIDDEIEYFRTYNLKRSRNAAEIEETYKIIKDNGLGYLEDEKKNRFCKAVVCGNMRILTEDEEGNCHVTFSGINVPYVLSGGKGNYSPEKFHRMMKEKGIFRLYDEYFNTGKKYTIFESQKTALDYKHYNMVLNDELGHICQTIKEMPIEINGDPEAVARDIDNIQWLGVYYNAN